MSILLSSNFNQFSLHFDQNQILYLVIQSLQYSSRCQLASQEKIKAFDDASYMGSIHQFIIGTSLFIPCGVEKIDSQIKDYWYKSKIESIEVPDTVQIINRRAFQNCTNLQLIKITNSVTSIGYYAFFNCTSLKYVSIPDSVYKIGIYTFKMCQDLQNVKLSSNIDTIPEGMFYQCSKLKNIQIPEKVKFIETGAFNHCNTLSIIVIPANVEYIGEYAFMCCYSIITVMIKNFDIKVERNAFLKSSAQCQYDFEYKADLLQVTQIKSWFSLKQVMSLSNKIREYQCQQIMNISSYDNYIHNSNGCFGIKKFCNNTDNSVNKQIVN